jgi:hypothetical protein
MRGEFLHEWQESHGKLSGSTSFYGLIAVAISKADSNNLRKLRFAWPELTMEMQARVIAPAGCLCVDELDAIGLKEQREHIVIIDITENNHILVKLDSKDNGWSKLYEEEAHPSVLRGLMNVERQKHPFVMPTRAAFLRMEEEDGWLAAKAVQDRRRERKDTEA